VVRGESGEEARPKQFGIPVASLLLFSPVPNPGSFVTSGLLASASRFWLLTADFSWHMERGA
jgi:hypothetical protein